MTSRWVVLEATLIGLVALLLRLVNLEIWPRWYVDEGIYAIRGVNILQGIYGYVNWDPHFLSPLLPPLFGLMEMVFGKSYFFVRLPAAIMGSISCVVLYLIGARLYNRFVGVVAALVLAVASVHINRMAMIDNGVELFFLLTVFFYLKAREEEKQRWGYLMGTSAGLAFLSKYSGVAALIFIVVQSLADKTFLKIWRGLPAFGAVALVSPIVGLIVDWNAFVFDTLEYGTREPRLGFLFDLLIKGHYGSQLYPPAIYFNIWSTLGFVSLFYVLGRGRFGDRLCAVWAAATLITYVAYGKGFFVFLVVLYPVYSLAIAATLYDIVQAKGNPGALAAFSFFLTLPVFALQHLQPSIPPSWGRALFLGIPILAFLILLAKQPWFQPPSPEGAWLSGPGGARGQKVLHGLTLVPIAVVLLAGSLFELKPIFSTNDVADQRATVDWLNANASKGDLVAATTPIIQLLETAVGIFNADVVFYTTREAFLEYKLELLSRYKMDSSLEAMDYFVVDTPLASLGPGGPIVATTVKEGWTKVFAAGDYQIYWNPTRPLIKGVPILDDRIAQETKIETIQTDRLLVTDDVAEKKSGQDSLRIDFQLEENNTLYLYQALEPQDWSGYSEMAFWWHGDNVGIVAVDVLAPDYENYYHLAFTDNWKGWGLVRLSLPKATPLGEPSWKNVSMLALKFQSLPAAGTVRLDDLKLN